MQNLASRFVVELHLSYTVEADTPDSALRAVLPMVGNAESANYSVRSITKTSTPATPIEPHSHLTKATHKAKEVAEILGIARNAVYERVPCIRVGSRRLYPRATIIEILQHGLKKEEPLIDPVGRTRHEPIQKAPKIVRESKPKAHDLDVASSPDKPLTVRDAAVMLGVSYAKAKELFETRKIYSLVSNGKRIVVPAAVHHFLRGGTPLQFVETLIDYARSNGTFEDARALERAANGLREQ